MLPFDEQFVRIHIVVTSQYLVRYVTRHTNEERQYLVSRLPHVIQLVAFMQH